MGTSQECADQTDDQDVYFHIPADPDNETGWCSLAVFSVGGDAVLFFDSGSSVPPTGNYLVSVSVFQTFVPDEEFLSFVVNLVDVTTTSGNENYSVLASQLTDAACQDATCIAPIDEYSIDPNLPITCTVFAFLDPLHLTVFCVSSSLHE